MNAGYYLNQFKFLLGFGGLMTIYGGAGFAVYYLGKYAGIQTSTRVVIIALLLLTMPFALVGGYLVKRKQKKKEAAEKEAAEAGEEEAGDKKPDEGKPSAPSGNYEDLSQGADEVTEFLKTSKLGAGGKESVYSLPWYLVIGGKGSGKTSLVLSSDLDFQALPSQRQSELNLVRPTKQVDWRITGDAVFIDTSGRFQASPDLDEWSSLIDTIKKHRPKRPLDGLLLTVNTEHLLQADERAIEEKAKAIRARLDDATKRLKTRFPVYLVFTHADAIEGFRDSFSMSKKDGDNLVWGSTIPLEKSENAQALFDGEYEILQDSVMKRRLIRLSAPFSPVRQLRIFNFPLHFGSARRKLGSFVSTLFRPNPFSESPFLRGFYFTASPANLQRGRGKPGKMPRTLGDTYFTKKFFRDVVLRDKDLVRTFYEQRQKPPILGWVLTTIATLLVITFLGLSGLSLYNNKMLVEDAAASGEEVMLMTRADRDKDLATKSDEEAQQEINKLERLRKQLARLDEFEREGPPIEYRFGFYSGSRIFRERLLYIYYVGVENRFRRPAIARLQRDLDAFSRTKSISAGSLTPEEEKRLDKHYDLLKAYLMLTSEFKDRSDPATITEALEEIWIKESNLPEGNESKAKEQLRFYFKQIDRESTYDGDSSGFPRLTENKTLVRAVRSKLEAFPPYLRYLKLSIAEASKDKQPVTVDTLLQGRSQGVLSGTHPIPYAFTMEGYRNFMVQAFVEAATKMNKDDWVMGKKSEDAQASSDDLAKLRDKYFNDYTDNWRKLIRDTQVIKYESQADLTKSLSAFSDTDSPMKLLLNEIAANTDFSTKTEAKGWFDFSWISDWWSGAADTEDSETLNVVEREFRPLFTFIGSGEGSDDEGAAISKYGAQVKDLSEELGNISASEKTTITNELVQEKGTRYRLIRGVETKVNDLTKGFETQAGKEVAGLLRAPVISVRAYFGKGALDQLEKDWAQRILPKAREIESGYPFTNDGEADLNKVSAFLNPVTGELSKYYKERLERYFEEVNGQLRVKETSDVKFSPGFVAYLNNAFKLRRALFGDNATPNFEYGFRLLPIADALIEISIDGQTVTSDQTGSNTLKFPAATGTSNGVLMRFSSTAGGTTLPGTIPTPGGSTNTAVPALPAPVQNFQDTSGSGEIRHQGTWGLFKFFDAGSPAKQPNGEYLLTYTLAGRKVQATVKPTGGDLFDKSIFRNVKAPDRMQN